MPSERDWERSSVLEPRPAPRRPELVSDGAGLPFPPSALDGTPAPLDPQDPAVGALAAQLASRAAPKRGTRALWRRRPAPEAPPANLDGWRLLARTDDEALFGRGQPPQLLTVAVRRNPRRNTWAYDVSSAARPLRAARDGIRASSWRLDPSCEPDPGDSVLRVLVSEQTFASGQRADGRVLVPDLHMNADQIVLTMFVKPRPGFQAGSPNPETPVRIALPEPVGLRRLIDGALANLSAHNADGQPPA